jgi:hypothetical protein
MQYRLLKSPINLTVSLLLASITNYRLFYSSVWKIFIHIFLAFTIRNNVKCIEQQNCQLSILSAGQGVIFKCTPNHSKKIMNLTYIFIIENILLLIPGPAFWGLINPEWSLCNKGRRQSPVNLEPQRLLFDPNLRPLHLDKHRVN